MEKWRKTITKWLWVVLMVVGVSIFVSREDAFAATNGSLDESKAYQVVELVNEQRALNGEDALLPDQELMDAAAVRAKELVQLFSHTRPDGTNCSTVSSKVYGENIAYGYTTADWVMEGWMNSSGHRANILSSSYQSIGVGCYYYNGYYYWVQLFSTYSSDGITSYNGVDYSAVYDYNYYLDKYADLAAVYSNDPLGALQHFINYGMKEGRQASADFNVTSYRYQYQDLRLAYGTNLKSYYMHYINCGKSEGRQATGTTSLQNPVTSYGGVNYSSVYDYEYYLSKYSDLKKVYANDDVGLLQHFINYGMKEGRQASANFNVTSYRYQYQDLRLAYGTNLKSYYLHYINCGKSEGRQATGTTSLKNPVTSYGNVNYALVYDYDYYLNKYSDLKKIYTNDDVGLLQHFINYGMKEGRQASATFNVAVYRASNADLQKAFGSDLKAYYNHYLVYGKNENRQTY